MCLILYWYCIDIVRRNSALVTHGELNSQSFSSTKTNSFFFWSKYISHPSEEPLLWFSSASEQRWKIGFRKSNFSEENLKLLQSRKNVSAFLSIWWRHSLIVSTFEDRFQKQDRLLFWISKPADTSWYCIVSKTGVKLSFDKVGFPKSNFTLN